jgi:tyrosine-protein kinase Etk/Wzc
MMTDLAPSQNSNPDEISIAELIKVLWDGRKWIAGITSVFIVLGVVYALMATPIFQAETTIMPPQQQQSAAASMMAALGGIGGGGGGIGAALGLKNPNDIYVAMFKSKRVADSLIRKFELMNYYEQNLRILTIKRLGQSTQVNAGKDGLISIKVQDQDPKMAADLANAYVDEFKKLTKDLAVSEASQRRKYFEDQLNFTKNHLARAEGEFQIFQEKSGLIQVD